MNENIKVLVSIYQKIINVAENNKYEKKLGWLKWGKPAFEINDSKKDEYIQLISEFVETINCLPDDTISKENYETYRKLYRDSVDAYLNDKPIDIPVSLFGLALFHDLLTNKRYPIYDALPGFAEKYSEVILQM